MDILISDQNLAFLEESLESGIKAQQLTCDICDKVFKFPSKLLRHKESVHCKDYSLPFHCNVCPFKAGSEDTLRRHINRHKTVIKCETCDFSTTSIFNLERHVKQHEKKTIPCDICMQFVASVDALRKHKKNKH